MNRTPPRVAAARVDTDAFLAALDAIEREIRAGVGPEDLAHYQKIVRWGRACSLLGYASAWIAPNPVSALLISQGRVNRWAFAAHHALHDGLKKVPGVPARLTRGGGFARGRRRYVDWFDVLQPDAWHEEHNCRHHPYTSQVEDPDLVEVNLQWLRDAGLPRPVKLAVVAFMASTWKWTYYAPNLLVELRHPGRADLLESGVFDPRCALGRELWLKGYLPYAGWHFVGLPLLFSPLGPWAAFNVAANSLMAEWICNLHSFLIIVTNHAGGDLARFEGQPADRGAWVLRQILSSTNFRTGGDLNDFLHGWLNYQIEHHIWPNLSPRQYQRAQPLVRAACERFGVPYTQESVFTRLKKTVSVMIGDADMLRSEG